MLDVREQIRQLENNDPVAPADVIEEARAYLKTCTRSLALSSSFLANVIISMHRIVVTTAVDTWAVTLAGDGFSMLLINPFFTKQLADEPNVPNDQGKVVLYHEACHLRNLHLYVQDMQGDEDWTMATEASINYEAKEVLSQELPVIDGKSSGVDPDKVYETYRKDLADQGLNPVSKKDFYRTDLGTYSEIKRMKKPFSDRKMRTQVICVHGQPGDGDGKPGQGQPGGLDQAEVDRLMKSALGTAMHEAKVNNNKLAREELLRLGEKSEGSEKASQIWGDLGLGSLRGETMRTRRTDYWDQWLFMKLGERLQDGMKLQYQKKVWWDPRVSYRGQEPILRGVVAVDASGSMRQDDLKWISERIGETENLIVDWLSFDAGVWPFELGEPFQGGGGTSFQVVSDYVEEMEEEPDFIIMVTDGHAPPITPRDAEKWIWLITPGGSDWPATKSDKNPAMDCQVIDTGRASERAA